MAVIVGAIYNIASYRNVLSDICKANGLDCKLMFGYFMIPHDLFIGSTKDILTYNIKSRVYYIVVEGYIPKFAAYTLKNMCNKGYCVTITKWGKSILEQYGANIADVVYHGLPIGNIPEPSLDRKYDVIYLNSSYKLLRNWKHVDRKGWQFWPEAHKAFPNSKGYTNAKLSLPGVEVYDKKTIDEIYSILNSGRVFANLSMSEGFGLNPLMALAVGTNVVFWNFPVFRELYEGVQGVYFVPSNTQFYCNFPDNVLYNIVCSHGDIHEYIDVVRYALSGWTMADYQTIRQKFDPYKVYKPFGEYIMRR